MYGSHYEIFDKEKEDEKKTEKRERRSSDESVNSTVSGNNKK